eukprot:CAMPEP_0182455452 /NCGR_PEP_ID=MMETSP1319-20130603/1608_1 /TAXON_ID=172717 /ORGANISM="Bolidomonas pacifica, Strain RCC208" /LENGTH=319 /DNA_ID=CAMNT_0024653511 /DNA_START=19 /DNA_END=978 /DNA_ORIENTATION=+
MKTVAIIAAAMLGFAAADQTMSSFLEFASKHNKVYSSEQEMQYRFQVFKDNLATAAERNAKEANATHGVTKFMDLTPEEFRMHYLNYRPSEPSNPEVDMPRTSRANAASINWADKGATTPVKDQGQCGSCWAFSATEQIETDYYFNSGSLQTLAPQQIVSCDTTSYGCNGGWTEHAYDYVVGAGGIESESAYPYTSGTTELSGRCKFDASQIAVTPTGYNTISSSASGESKMLTQIASSPMSICVDAESWQTYTSGVVTSATCGTSVDHCVQVVGYESNNNYWIVRNSWATSWGEQGYIYVAEGENACAIASDATTVTF